MKAIRIHTYGGPEALVYEDAPRPEIADDEVLIKVHAARGQPGRSEFTRAGYLQGMVDLPLPLTLGFDLSGVVEAIGKDVTSVAVGDAVYGYSNMMRQGAYAEYAAVSATEIAPKPTTHRPRRCRRRPAAGLAAWQALEAAGLQAGQTILIHGAGGGVGTFAVQFALAKGARVLGTASADKVCVAARAGRGRGDRLHDDALRGCGARCRRGAGYHRRRGAGALLGGAQAGWDACDNRRAAGPSGGRQRAACAGSA